ncbi:MAG: DsbA family protein [Calothrix sp. FI2-JRJ7]|jgi:protein-disulfide isomerase|nr:DsbA family protein [Calothrix sp. FI2-JRJ7]
MNNFIQTRVLRIAVLIICFTVLLWAPPVQAASRLEEQVLKIIKEHPEALIDSVQRYQQEQQSKLQQTRQAFLQDLRMNPQQVIGESPATGDAASKAILVEFSDFQCPYCAEAHKTLKKLLAKYPDKFTLVYKHFPLPNTHPQAVAAAQAAWAAQQQGKFWEYEDALFTNQNKLGEEFYIETAKNLNLDLDKFAQDRAIANDTIRKDVLLATQLGVSGTPFFVLNTDKYSGGIELSEIEKIIKS